MLETEIKKLTEALVANTAAILASSGGNHAEVPGVASQARQVVGTTVPATTQPFPVAGPGAITPAAVSGGTFAPSAPGSAPGTNAVPTSQAQAPAGPAVAPSPPAATQQVAPPVQQPPAGPQMDHKTAQAELGAIVQALGDGAPVQAIMQQYGSARLNEIPVENLFALVQSCKALLQ